MPKVPGFTDDAGVALNTPLSEGSGFRLSNDTANIGLQAMGMRSKDLSALAQLYNSVAIRNQAMINNIKVSEAKAAAMDEMNQNYSELMNQQGTNVLAQTDLNGKTVQKDLMGRWNDSSSAIVQKNRMALQNDIQRAAYDQAMNAVVTEKSGQIFNHQLLQTKDAMNQQQNAVTNSYISSATSAAQIGDATGAKQYWNEAIKSRQQTDSIQGIPYDAQVQNNQNKTMEFLTGIESKIPAANFGSLIEQFKDNLRPEQVNSLKQSNKAALTTSQAKNDAKYIVDNSRLPNGDVDLVKVRQFIKNAEDNRAKATYKQNFGFDAFKKAYAENESGGNYEAYNADSGAYGKYQITPGLWADLMRQNGLPEDTPMSPENQDKYFTPYLEKAYTQFGPEGALVAMYAGWNNGERWAKGYKTGIDDNGNEYSFYDKQGDYPSVAEYVQNGINAMSKYAPPSDLTFDTQYNKALEEAVNEEVKNRQIEISQINQNHLELAMQYAQNNPNASYSDLKAYAMELEPNSAQRRQALINAMQGERGAEYSGNNFDIARQFDAATEYILNNPNATEADLRMNFPNLPLSKIKSLTAAVGKAADANTKWLNSETQAMLSGLTKQNKLTDIDKANIINSMNVWAKDKYAKTGTPPSDDEVNSQLRNLASKAKITQSRFIFGNTLVDAKYPNAALGDGWTPLTETTAQDSNGNVFEYDPDLGTWTTEID